MSETSPSSPAQLLHRIKPSTSRCRASTRLRPTAGKPARRRARSGRKGFPAGARLAMTNSRGVTAMMDEGRRVLIDLPFEAAVGATTAAIHRGRLDDPRTHRRAGTVQERASTRVPAVRAAGGVGPRGGVRGDSTRPRCGRARAGAVRRLRACRRRDRGDRRRTQRARPARARPPSPAATRRQRRAGCLKPFPSTGGGQRRP